MRQHSSDPPSTMNRWGNYTSTQGFNQAKSNGPISNLAAAGRKPPSPTEATGNSSPDNSFYANLDAQFKARIAQIEARGIHDITYGAAHDRQPTSAFTVGTNKGTQANRHPLGPNRASQTQSAENSQKKRPVSDDRGSQPAPKKRRACKIPNTIPISATFKADDLTCTSSRSLTVGAAGYRINHQSMITADNLLQRNPDLLQPVQNVNPSTDATASVPQPATATTTQRPIPATTITPNTAKASQAVAEAIAATGVPTETNPGLGGREPSTIRSEVFFPIDSELEINLRRYSPEWMRNGVRYRSMVEVVWIAEQTVGQHTCLLDQTHGSASNEGTLRCQRSPMREISNSANEVSGTLGNNSTQIPTSRHAGYPGMRLGSVRRYLDAETGEQLFLQEISRDSSVSTNM